MLTDYIRWGSEVVLDNMDVRMTWGMLALAAILAFIKSSSTRPHPRRPGGAELRLEPARVRAISCQRMED
ncbi:hypothetical protein [Paracoccus niistensis]|uniref:Uncharacterized protein n=1 Tax=Paracoccus niistensis TaxID=632935 RepID=A0ABV6I1Y1_9RHOB